MIRSARKKALPSNHRRGANAIHFPPDCVSRLESVKDLVGAENKAALARLAVDWALTMLESGEMVILNGKLVPNPNLKSAAAA